MSLRSELRRPPAVEVGSVDGKGRALRATKFVTKDSLLFWDKPLLCTAYSGLRNVCDSCLGDSAEYCELCDQGTCSACSPHVCRPPIMTNIDSQGLLFVHLYIKYVQRLIQASAGSGEQDIWSEFARLSTSVIGDAWAEFDASSQPLVEAMRKRYGEAARNNSLVCKALTREGFLDFVSLAMANSASVGTCLTRGIAIFKTHACMNHACDANAVSMAFKDIPSFCETAHTDAVMNGSIAVFATRSIDVGEEVCISYLGLDEDPDELPSRYGFRCCCTRCQSVCGRCGRSNGPAKKR